MADSEMLLNATDDTTVLGNVISLKMVSFIEDVKDQPAGFRDLGLDFLSICQILNALSSSLSSHFSTGQAFPRQAVPELMQVLAKTKEDFKQLQSLLEKFMDYEKGGAFARLQKTWRIMFADKDIAKVRASLQASKGALTMTMLLTNINPNAAQAPTGYEYGMLAAKLQQTPHNSSISTSPVVSELEGDSKVPQELPDNSIARGSAGGSSYGEITPSISNMSISERSQESNIISSIKPEIPEPKSLMSDSSINATVEEVEPKSRIPELPAESTIKIEPNSPAKLKHEETLASASSLPTRIRIDRSTLIFTVPTSTTGGNNASLQNTLLSALSTQKHEIITKLLSRGVSPSTAPISALINAIKFNDIKSLKLLLSYGADPNLPAGDGNTPLRCACQYADREESIELLLQYGADPNLCAPDMPPLPFALLEKNEKIVSILLAYGADPNLIMKNGSTPFLYACERENVPLTCVKSMLLYDADPNIQNRDKTSTLYTACVRNREPLVSLLLANGANPDLVGPGIEIPLVPAVRYPPILALLLAAKVDLKARKGIMELAVCHNQIESVRLLLQAGVDPNEKSQNVFSPLTTAIRENRPEILALLLSSGVDPNLKGQEIPLYMATKFPSILTQMIKGGADPTKAIGVMEMAVYHNQIKSVEILLAAGVDPNEKKDGCFSPLTTAIRDNRTDILDFLLSHGVDPNLKGQDVPLHMASRQPHILKQLLACPQTDLGKGQGALEMAVFYNNIESVQILLNAGVDPNEKKDNLFTPLTTAVRDNKPEILALLLKSGADPNFKGQDIPLVLAVRHPTILKQLIDGGADVTKAPGMVEAAVAQKCVEAVDILLAAGAGINEKRMNVYTPLCTALSQNSSEMIEHLLHKGADPNFAGAQGLPVVMAAGFRDPKQERLRSLLNLKTVDINAKGPGGKTALMEACEKGIGDNVVLLLEKGADVEAVDGAGRSAMDLAAAQGKDDIVMLLLDNMG